MKNLLSAIAFNKYLNLTNFASQKPLERNCQGATFALSSYGRAKHFKNLLVRKKIKFLTLFRS